MTATPYLVPTALPVRRPTIEDSCPTCRTTLHQLTACVSALAAEAPRTAGSSASAAEDLLLAAWDVARTRQLAAEWTALVAAPVDEELFQ